MGRWHFISATSKGGSKSYNKRWKGSAGRENSKEEGLEAGALCM